MDAEFAIGVIFRAWEELRCFGLIVTTTPAREITAISLPTISLIARILALR
jgi:hypothetical protein